MDETAQTGPTDELAGLLADLASLAKDRERLTLDEMLTTIGPRGFGPVIVVMALILILPVGMIPGMPGFVAVVLAAIGVELGLGHRALRPPRRLRRVTVPAGLVRRIARRLAPLARWSARAMRPRLLVLATARLGTLILSVTLLLSALIIFFAGFLPGLPFALAWPLLLIGLGLTARDGLAVAAGLSLYLPAGLTILVLLPGGG